MQRLVRQVSCRYLNAVYSLAEEYVNLIQPVLKFIEKKCDRPRVRAGGMTQLRTHARRLRSLGNLAVATRRHLDTWR
jgi:hypothetical protein